MKKKLFDLLVEGVEEEESNNQDMASGDEVSLEKEAVRTPGRRMVDASSVNSPEFEALVTFLADRVLKIYPEDVKSSKLQITTEDSAILHPNAAPKVSLGFSDDGTHIDANYDDKLYFFVGYTLANFQKDFGAGESGQINEQIKRMQIIAGLVKEEYEEEGGDEYVNAHDFVNHIWEILTDELRGGGLPPSALDKAERFLEKNRDSLYANFLNSGTSAQKVADGIMNRFGGGIPEGEQAVEEADLSMDAYERMDSLASMHAVKSFIKAANEIANGLYAEDFDGEDIFEYLVSRIRYIRNYRGGSDMHTGTMGDEMSAPR